MPKKRPAQTNEPRHAKLLMPKSEAEQKITAQIESGKKISQATIASRGDFDAVNAKMTKWRKYTSELLRCMFDTGTFASEFGGSAQVVAVGVLPNLQRDINLFRKSISARITTLESILQRLELFSDIGDEFPAGRKPAEARTFGSDIFVVHGHDDAAKETLARFISKLDLTPIILHEKPNAGRTIIEKFEAYSNVGFAVVLLTPDDEGRSVSGKGDLSLRARQNVIMELGFFLGKLGRQRVCSLYKGDVEIPSDYQGVIFVPMDAKGAWKLELAKEIKAAGIHFDFNKAI